jgi:hypothetical protein
MACASGRIAAAGNRFGRRPAVFARALVVRAWRIRELYDLGLGATYRIVPAGPGTYDAVRLLDDARTGSFRDAPPFSLSSPLEGEALLRQVRTNRDPFGKDSWVTAVREGIRLRASF